MLNANLSDDVLWDAILNDDSMAFAMLYDRYWLRLYKTACHYIKDTDACEEIVHDVFIIIWNKRKFLKIEHFASYLNAIVRYEVFRHMKTVKLSKLEYNENYAENLTELALNQGQVKLNELDLEYMLNEHVKKLPKRCREIFYMSKVQQLSNGEIAKKLGITKHTVENQLTFALKLLKNSIKDLSAILILIYFLV